MRIIAGRLKRRKLLANPGIVTRPITDRVKVSLFQFLESDLEDARVADIFPAPARWDLKHSAVGLAQSFSLSVIVMPSRY